MADLELGQPSQPPPASPLCGCGANFYKGSPPPTAQKPYNFPSSDGRRCRLSAWLVSMWTPAQGNKYGFVCADCAESSHCYKLKWMSMTPLCGRFANFKNVPYPRRQNIASSASTAHDLPILLISNVQAESQQTLSIIQARH